jgi:hypothetical protein
VCTAPKSAGPAKIDVNMMVASQVARDDCDRRMKNEASENAELVKEIAEKSVPGLLAIDDTFDVEFAIIESLTGLASEKRLMDAILDAMPSKATEISPASALQRVTALAAHGVYKYSTRPFQGKHSVILRILGRIVDGRAPDLQDAAKDVHMSGFIGRLQYFIRYDADDGKGSAMKFGSEALTYKYKVVKGNPIKALPRTRTCQSS